MIDEKYNPCGTKCEYRVGMNDECPAKYKAKCPLNQVCDGLNRIGGMVYSLPIDLIVQTLRNMGYAGELKKVTVTNI